MIISCCPIIINWLSVSCCVFYCFYGFSISDFRSFGGGMNYWNQVTNWKRCDFDSNASMSYCALKFVLTSFKIFTMDSLRHYCWKYRTRKKSNPEWETLLIMTDGCLSQEIAIHGLIKRHFAWNIGLLQFLHPGSGSIHRATWSSQTTSTYDPFCHCSFIQNRNRAKWSFKQLCWFGRASLELLWNLLPWDLMLLNILHKQVYEALCRSNKIGFELWENTWHLKAGEAISKPQVRLLPCCCLVPLPNHHNVCLKFASILVDFV